MATTEMNFDFIVRTIQKGKCVLFLGPEVVRTEKGENGKPLNKALVEFLDVKNNRNVSMYYETDDMLFFPNGMARTRTCYQLEEFYNKTFTTDILEKLSLIPFPLIISTTPDLFLKSAFDKNALPYQFDFYSFNQNPKEVQKPTKDIPLIYNLFGSIQKEDSLILSHLDLYNFLFAILGDYKLPKELKNTISMADNLIFLGFQFDKWYMQILLRLFNLHEESFDRYAANDAITVEVQDFYNKQFNISFVDKQVDVFVENLFQKCKDLNVVKSTESKQIPVSKQVTSLIESDQVEKALQVLKIYFEKKNDVELIDDITLLTSRLSRLQRKIERGIIEKEEEQLEINKLKDSILNINKEVEN